MMTTNELSFGDGNVSVHDDMLDANGRRAAYGESGAVRDPVGIENDNVGCRAGTQDAAILQIQPAGGCAGHFVDRFFQAENGSPAHVLGDDARKRAIAAWVRLPADQHAIAAHHSRRVAEHHFVIGFAAARRDDRRVQRGRLQEFDDEERHVHAQCLRHARHRITFPISERGRRRIAQNV